MKQKEKRQWDTMEKRTRCKAEGACVDVATADRKEDHSEQCRQTVARENLQIASRNGRNYERIAPRRERERGRSFLAERPADQQKKTL